MTSSFFSSNSRLDGLLLLVVDQLLGAEPSTPRTTLGSTRTRTNRQALLDRGRHAVQRSLPPFQPLLNHLPRRRRRRARRGGRGGGEGEGSDARDEEGLGRLRQPALDERGADRCLVCAVSAATGGLGLTVRTRRVERNGRGGGFRKEVGIIRERERGSSVVWSFGRRASGSSG